MLIRKILFKLFIVFGYASVAILCWVFASVSYTKVNELEKWHKITINIESSNIEESRRSKGVTYCPNITANYSFNGKHYTSKLDVNDGPCSPILLNVTNTLKKYRVGSNVEVSVNPLRPEEIRVSNFSLGIGFYLSAFSGVLVTSLALFFLFLPLSKLDEKKLKFKLW